MVNNAVSELWYKGDNSQMGYGAFFSSKCTVLRVREVPGIQTRLVSTCLIVLYHMGKIPETSVPGMSPADA